MVWLGNYLILDTYYNTTQHNVTLHNHDVDNKRHQKTSIEMLAKPLNHNIPLRIN